MSMLPTITGPGGAKDHTGPQAGESETDFMDRCVVEHQGDGEMDLEAAVSHCQQMFAASRMPDDPTNPQLESNRRKLGL